MFELYPIPSRTDNYIWALVNTANKTALIVDPGEANPVMSWLDKNNYQLTDIFITHHHYDHTEGLPELIAKYNPTVYAAAADNISGTTHALAGGEKIHLESLDVTFEVLAIPGHTGNHLAYYAKPYLFCGDTLFSAGCGRLLGGTIEQMFESLKLLKQLPDDTLVCCAHEYTLNNINFAKQYDKDNKNLLDYEATVIQLREQQLPSLPVLLGIEKAVNPFLRTEQPQIQQAISKASNKPVAHAFEAFKALRELKDCY